MKRQLTLLVLFSILSLMIFSYCSSISISRAQQYPYPSSSYPSTRIYPSTALQQYPYQNLYPYNNQNPQQPSPFSPPAATAANSSPQYPYQIQQQQPPFTSSSPPLLPQQQQNPPIATANGSTTTGSSSGSAGIPQYPNQQYPIPNQQQQQQPQTSPSSSSSSLTATTNFPMPTLIVITRTNNTGAAAMVATNSSLSPVPPLTTSFSQVVTNAYANPDGFTVAYHYTRASQTGVVSIPLQPGFYSISDQSSSSNNQTNTLGQSSSSSPSSSTPLSSYTPTYSGDCRTVRSLGGSMVGYGQINIGETKTCIVTYVFHR